MTVDSDHTLALIHHKHRFHFYLWFFSFNFNALRICVAIFFYLVSFICLCCTRFCVRMKKKSNNTHKLMALYLEKFTWWPHWFQWQHFATTILADKSHCFEFYFFLFSKHRKVVSNELRITFICCCYQTNDASQRENHNNANSKCIRQRWSLQWPKICFFYLEMSNDHVLLFWLLLLLICHFWPVNLKSIHVRNHCQYNIMIMNHSNTESIGQRSKKKQQHMWKWKEMGKKSHTDTRTISICLFVCVPMARQPICISSLHACLSSN